MNRFKQMLSNYISTTQKQDVSNVVDIDIHWEKDEPCFYVTYLYVVKSNLKGCWWERANITIQIAALKGW